MLYTALLLVGAFALVSSSAIAVPPVSSKKLSLKNQAAVINYINNKQSLWKAGKNFDDNVSETYLKRLASARRPEEPLPMLEVDRSVTDDYPENFDARTKWSNCPSISHIYDQGNCGSCWAVAATSVMADRTCIGSKGQFTSQISAQELMSCCKSCGNGCEGGWPDKAFKFFQKHGISTGGDYDSNEGCMPYEVKPCSHHTDGKYPDCKSYNSTETPPCRSKCSNPHYSTPVKRDRHFGDGAWTCCKHGAKYQLNDFGPITAGFTVYEDFYHYKSGIYTHTWGKKVGYHIVRVIGWGKENGVEYWLAANSWNSDWGDKGTFKIKAMVDECNFEEFFALSFPKEKKQFNNKSPLDRFTIPTIPTFPTHHTHHTRCPTPTTPTTPAPSTIPTSAAPSTIPTSAAPSTIPTTSSTS